MRRPSRPAVVLPLKPCPPLSGHPPDTYEDFLLMTRAPLPREPSAAARARGLAVG